MKRYTETTEKKWFAIAAEEAVFELNSDLETGLTDQDFTVRLDQFGPNSLPLGKRKHALIRFLEHFNDILIYILFAAAIVSTVLGHILDAGVILLVAVINAMIGYIQENKADKAIDDLKGLLSLRADVLRSGLRREIDAADLVPGDIVLFSPGDRIPADLRIFSADNLKIDEATLTGESLPTEKKTEPLAPETMLGDRNNMAFSGTTVMSGTGRGIVVTTGSHTEIGKINEMMADVKKITTPLLKQTAQFGKTISIVILSTSVLLYCYGLIVMKNDPVELLMMVIALAVAAIPEGLPAILSIILAVGVRNMAARKATVRNLPSVETLGAVSVICSDKTGTLTKNEMTVRNVVIRDGEFNVTGTGYSPEGDIIKEDQKVAFDQEPVLHELIVCGDLCNESTLTQAENDSWKVNGDPTEGALIALFQKADINHDEPPRLATIPFDSEYKYMATLVDAGEQNVIYIKGAPDRLFDMAISEKTRTGEEPFDQHFWTENVARLARKGQRVLGMARKIVDKSVTSIVHEDIHDDIVFLGLAGIIDPPKEAAIEAVRTCKEAGIRVKMITGDHVETAKAIGLELGIGDGQQALSGSDIDGMNDAELMRAVSEIDIFARTSPEHKLELVEALQENGNICAMTGDGVNDAPALRKADVGIAMGIKGTDVTKDAAEVVLVDDNFATIIGAVEEGRRVYDNLKKTILFILPTNGAVSLLVLTCILFGTPMPLTPVLILWVNMVTSVTVSLALAFEKLEVGAMQRPPRLPDEPLLCGYFLWRIAFVSFLIGGMTLAMEHFLLQKGVCKEIVMTITLQTVVFSQLFHLFNCRSIRGPAWDKNFWTNPLVFFVSALLVLLQLGITYLPVMNTIFGTTPLNFSAWIYPILIGLVVFVVVELEKATATPFTNFR